MSHHLTMARWVLICVLGSLAGCGGGPDAPVAASAPDADADARRLLARTRELERELRDLRQQVDRLARDVRNRDAALRVLRARLADRQRELAALWASPPEAVAERRTDPTDSTGETAPDYVRRMLDEIAADPAAALDQEIDWPGFVATMLAEEPTPPGAPARVDPAAATSALAALPEAEREAAFAGARELLNEMMGGAEGLTALKPRVGEHYRLGNTVRVELLATDADGGEQRFTLSVARPEARWRIVGLARD